MTRTLRAAFRNLSLVHKLVLLNVAIAGVVLAAGSAAVVSYDISRARARMVEDLRRLGAAIGSNSTAAIALGDTVAEEDILRGAATVDAHVLLAALVLPNHRQFARYEAPGNGTQSESADLDALSSRILAVAKQVDRSSGEWHVFEKDRLRIAVPIDVASNRVGVVYLESDLEELGSRQLRYAAVIGVALIAALVLALALSIRLQRVISAPIVRLTAI